MQNGNLLLGQAYNLYKALPGELERAWVQQYPDAPFIRYLSLGNTEILLVNNLQAHREVLQTKCYSFIKPPFWERIVGEIAGKGILFMEGEEHKKQRRLLVGIIPDSVDSSRLEAHFYAEKAPSPLAKSKIYCPFSTLKQKR